MINSWNDLVSAFLAVVVILSSISAYHHRRRNPHGLPYLPGPTPRFLVGNFFDIPKKRPYLEYAKWSKQYHSMLLAFQSLVVELSTLITNYFAGDIVSFHVPGFHTVVINSAKVAKELFEKRSAIYSDRPSMEMTNLSVFCRCFVGCLLVTDLMISGTY